MVEIVIVAEDKVVIAILDSKYNIIIVSAKVAQACHSQYGDNEV